MLPFPAEAYNLPCGAKNPCIQNDVPPPVLLGLQVGVRIGSPQSLRKVCPISDQVLSSLAAVNRQVSQEEVLSQGLLACWPRTPCSPSQQFMWPTDFVFLFWVLKQRLPPCLHSDPWCNHVHPYTGLGIGFCLLCIFLIHAFHFMYIGNMYPFPHVSLCYLYLFLCTSWMGVNGWRFHVFYLTMSPTSLFVKEMCYNLFIYLTEREQLIWKTPGGAGWRRSQPALCCSIFKASSRCYGS